MKLLDKDHPTILFEDNHVLVVDKQHGLLTQPDNTARPSLEEVCKAYIKVRDKKQGNVFLHVVHRIDKPVAGIVVFAKSKKALSRMQKSQREGMWHKEYHALVQGDPGAGQYNDCIEKGDNKAYISPKGKPSQLSYKTINGIVHIVLDSGRYHQIRVQFGSRKHPIVGDTKYGSTQKYTDGIALLHSKVTFPHPVLKKNCTFTSTIKLKNV